jgi:hypothetical protein
MNKNRCKFIVLLATIVTIGLFLSMHPARNFPQIRGSLSNPDVQAIRKELRSVRWGTACVPLSHWHFRVFGRIAKQNLKVRLVSVEGDDTQAIAHSVDHAIAARMRRVG